MLEASGLLVHNLIACSLRYFYFGTQDAHVRQVN